MRHLLITLAIALAAAFAGIPAAAAASGASSPAPWESVNNPSPAVGQALLMEDQTEATVSDGYIYIWSTRPVTIKIFSILGQLIAQEEVPAGLHRRRMASRGIYILKAGTLTRRIII